MTWRAPCGHVGEPVIGAYVACVSGCDGKPKACGKCGSPQIAQFDGYNIPSGACRCLPCGAVWWRPGM